MDFTDKRQSYEKGVLDESSLPSEPIVLFESWLQQAINNLENEPYAMSLATCGQDMMPSVRIVLLREVTENGVVFYTNYLSDKGQDLAQNPQAETLFFWEDMQRQVRIRGTVKKVSRAKTESYFNKRPYESQLGAWVSQPQSGEVASRDEIESFFNQLKNKYPDGTQVPTPEFWGGYELYADEFEFWQGRANRMHDRIVYSKSSVSHDWAIKRLLP